MKTNPLILRYRRTLSLYHKFKHRLERRLKNHSLQELSVTNRNRLLRTIERLKRRLASLQLQLKLGAAAAGLCLAIGTVEDCLAQAPTPVGSEFQVNTYTTSGQQSCRTAMDSDGDFVITWSSGQDGSGYGVYAQRYNAAGAAQGAEFQVNTYTTNQQRFPSIAMDSDGDFVITWQSLIQGGSYNGVYAQRYNAAGAAQGVEFQVNTYTNGQDQPSVAVDSDGDFVITWQDVSGQDGDAFGIYAQRYNASGMVQGAEFQVNTYTTNPQRFPSIAMDSDGDFVISWESGSQDEVGYDGFGVYAQRYNAAGVAQGAEFQVNTYTTGDQRRSSIAMDNDGDFVIAWMSYYQDGSVYGIYAQRYNAAGVVQGAEFKVNTYTTNYQKFPSIAMDNDGDFVIAWQSTGQDGSGYGVYAQRYNAAGVAQGTEFQVNSYTTSGQPVPSIAMDNDGDFVIAWWSYTQDGDGYGIYAQRYQIPNLPPVSAVNSGLTVNEGASQTITSAQLAFSDVDSPSSEIIFSVTGLPVNGTLSLGNNSLVLNEPFTQEDIDNNNISYAHDGSETTNDSFNFEVNDGTNFLNEENFALTITPVSDPPVLETNAGFSVDEGDSFTFTDTQLKATDIDNDASEIIYQLTGLPGQGTINISGSELGLNDTFTQEDIDNNNISFAHDGSETTTDAFNFELSDGTNNLNEATLNITVNPQNDDPNLTKNIGLTLDEGEEAFISKKKLNATDEDNELVELSFKVTRLPVNGSLNKDGEALGLNDTFTQKDINQDRISYQHDGSETTVDSFQFRLSDGMASLKKANFELTINPVDDGEQPTGLIEQLSNPIQLYPNPVYDKLFLDVTSMVGEELHLVVISSQGKTVSESTYSVIGSDLIEIDMSRFHPGLYILRLSDSKSIFWGKVQKL